MDRALSMHTHGERRSARLRLVSGLKAHCKQTQGIIRVREDKAHCRTHTQTHNPASRSAALHLSKQSITVND